MATTVPTPISLPRIVSLCFLALLNPLEFERQEERDNALLSAKANGPQSDPRIYKVRRALWGALLWTVSAMIVGAVLGFTIANTGLYGKVGPAIFGCAGALFLLWATLAVTGWHIQTWGGVSLAERVGGWFIKGLSWLGTVLLMIAAVLGLWI